MQELENYFSEHFDRTQQVPGPAAPESSLESESDTDDEPPRNADVDERSRRYIENVLGKVINRSSESESEAEGDQVRHGIAETLIHDDDPDIKRIRAFHAKGCGCKDQCVKYFKEEAMYEHILNVREMSKEEKEMYIMGCLLEKHSEFTKRGKRRQRTRHNLIYCDRRVCKAAFLLIFDIGKHTFKSIKAHVQESGVTPRVHGNIGKKPVHALNCDDTKRCVQFVSAYAEEHGMPQPTSSAPRGEGGSPPIYLSPDTTKKYLHQLYTGNCALENHRPLKYTTFCNIWSHCLPHIVIAKPKDDLCDACEKLQRGIINSAVSAGQQDRNPRMQPPPHNVPQVKGFINMYPPT